LIGVDTGGGSANSGKNHGADTGGVSANSMVKKEPVPDANKEDAASIEKKSDK